MCIRSIVFEASTTSSLPMLSTKVNAVRSLFNASCVEAQRTCQFHDGIDASLMATLGSDTNLLLVTIMRHNLNFSA